MVQRSQRLGIVLTLAEREEQAAGLQLQQARQSLSREQQQLEQLQQYNRDYLARINGQHSGLRGEDFISYRQFLQQLQQAEQAQANTVQRWQRQLQHLTGAWQQKYRRRQRIADWIARLRAGEELVLDRREQRLLDELAARAKGDW